MWSFELCNSFADLKLYVSATQKFETLCGILELWSLRSYGVARLRSLEVTKLQVVRVTELRGCGVTLLKFNATTNPKSFSN